MPVSGKPAERKPAGGREPLEGEIRYRSLFENISNGVAIFEAIESGKDFRFVDFNKSAEQIERVRRKDILGKPVTEVFPDIGRFGLLDVFRRVWRTGVPEQHPTSRYKDNRIVGWRDNFVYQLPSGEVVAVYTDETERKRAAQALVQSEARYRHLVDRAPLGILFVNAAGGAETANSKLLEILDLDRGSEATAVGALLDPLLSETGLAEDFQRCIDTGKALTCERRIQLSPRKTTYLKCHLAPQQNDAGKIIGVQALIEDISEKKQIEAQMLQAQKLEAIGTLAGGIAHDFNNILWIILGNTELASSNIPVGHPARYNLEQVEEACRRAQELVMQILQFSRNTEQEKKALKIATIVRESLRLLRASIPANIEIRQHISAETNLILADLTKINQMLMHLYANAAQAMKKTGGLLEVSIVDVELGEDEVSEHENLVPGKYVILTVLDTGTGIDGKVIDRIFDPFFTTHTTGDHTGMGLAIVNSIVKGHGGTLTVQSDPGKGSIFHIILPVIPDQSRNGAHPDSPPNRGSGRILFVDDEEGVLTMGKNLMVQIGYDVIAFSDPVEALRTFRSAPNDFDLIVTDQSMPNMTGLDLAKRLRRLRPDIRVVICTGFNEETFDKEAERIGIDRILLKPIGFHDLADVLQEMIKA